jgi:basic membrane protein A
MKIRHAQKGEDSTEEVSRLEEILQECRAKASKKILSSSKLNGVTLQLAEMLLLMQNVIIPENYRELRLKAFIRLRLGLWCDKLMTLKEKYPEFSDMERLHKLRLKVKRFRYGLQGVPEIYLPNSLLRSLKSLQDMLGLLHDDYVNDMLIGEIMQQYPDDAALQYEGAMLKVAAEYPEIKYLNFDFSSAEANALENVYAITYAANEIGYLAGVVAATKSQTGIVGGVGGMDNDGIKQFMAGYIQGAADVNPEVKVLISYVGDFQDTAKAKEISQNMINKGADVVWGCAGGAGNGVFEAVAENEGVWAIGVDTDQYVSMSGKPELAATILTSGLKNCDIAVCNSVIAMINEEVEYGTNKVLGYDDGAVGLAENDYYLQNMTEEELATVKSFADKVLNGETVVIDELVTPGVYDQYLAQYGLQ